MQVHDASVEPVPAVCHIGTAAARRRLQERLLRRRGQRGQGQEVEGRGLQGKELGEEGYKACEFPL